MIKANDFNLLLVDDEDYVIECIKYDISRIVEDYGINILEAETLKTAIFLVESKRVDFIITDYNIGNDLSSELIRHLHKNQYTIPVISFSGKMVDDLKEEFDKIGYGFILDIVKKSNKKKLADILDNYLTKK